MGGSITDHLREVLPNDNTEDLNLLEVWAELIVGHDPA
jgi:hypothetical protein